MTFAETQSLVADIQAIETWAAMAEKESLKDNPDYDRLEKLRGWLDEAKQVVFERCTK